MKRNGTSIAIPISFSELAWIALLFVSFAYLASTDASRTDLTLPAPVQDIKGFETTVDGLKREVTLLMSSNQSLRIEIANLKRSNDVLKYQVAALASTNSALSNLLVWHTQENHRLTNEVIALKTTNATLISRINQVLEENSNLKTASNSLAERNEQLRKEMRTLSGANQMLKERADFLFAENQRLTDLLRIPDADKWNEKGIRIDIVGLKGKLENVAIIFDTSGSMNTSDRWREAVKVVETWLKYLPISNCVLITFDDKITEYPDDGSSVKVWGSAGEPNRDKLLSKLRQIKPRGGTETFVALEKAYSHPEIDTIILFTDGKPNTNTSFKDITSKIYALAKQHTNVTVNTVGLGNYFEPRLAEFLMELAHKTGGGFLGR